MYSNFHRDNYIDLEEMEVYFVVQKSLIIAIFQILTNTFSVSFEEDQNKTTSSRSKDTDMIQQEHDDTPYCKNLEHDMARTDLLKYTF